MKERESMPLDGLWRFFPDHFARGEQLGFSDPGHCTRFWSEVPVPSVFEAAIENFDFYAGTCWYRREFCLPEAWRERRITLNFQGVNHRSRVWLNGTFIGENRDGFLPFEFDIRQHIRWDGTNLLSVSVDNSHHYGDVPGQHVGWRNYGGILREVSIYATDPLHIGGLRVEAEPAGDCGLVRCSLDVINADSRPRSGICEISITGARGETEPLVLGRVAFDMQPGESQAVIMEGRLPGARPWSPDTPVLYSVAGTLRESSATVDRKIVRTGFRRIEATPGGLLLNGERIFLTGFNRHEDAPDAAMATDLETVRRDLEQMKEAGCNFVRLCHYPHHPGEIDLCDELGLLTFCEVPLYFIKDRDKHWADYEAGRRENAARVASAGRQLGRLIERDRNHPSVIFWSVSNETEEQYAEIAEGNRALVRRARELDPTRLCVHVSNKWMSHPNFDEDDVICVNAYFSKDYRRKKSDDEQKIICGGAKKWSKELKQLHERYPDKLILITEFGFSSFSGIMGRDFGEDDHARVIKDEFVEGLDHSFVCGAVIWCWADHAWDPGRFTGGLGTSPYGVLSRDRRPLTAFWQARELFRQKQGLATSGQKLEGDAADGTVNMLRPHLKDIPEFSFPNGFGIRPMTRRDIGLWTDIQKDSEPYITITDRTFGDEFGTHLEAIKWRCFIVTDHKGLGVGVAGAWYDRDFRGQDHGRIHWIAVRPSHQGKGLGKAALSYAMRQLAKWHERAFLVTDVRRVAAVRMYLDFGFDPDFHSPGALAKWQKAAGKINHPVLHGHLKHMRVITS